jgi:hypothetical protein
VLVEGLAAGPSEVGILTVDSAVSLGHQLGIEYAQRVPNVLSQESIQFGDVSLVPVNREHFGRLALAYQPGHLAGITADFVSPRH